MNGTRGIAVLLLLALSQACVAAGSTEATIRELEQAQAKAAIARDRVALERIFSEDFRIINPSGAVATRDDLLKLLTGGPSPYQSATYQTDIVRDYGDIVVSVGMDTVVPNQGLQAGQKVLRRVTQVWKREQGTWRLTLRHANVITAP